MTREPVCLRDRRPVATRAWCWLRGPGLDIAAHTAWWCTGFVVLVIVAAHVAARW